jgi:hypothetical protein
MRPGWPVLLYLFTAFAGVSARPHVPSVAELCASLQSGVPVLISSLFTGAPLAPRGGIAEDLAESAVRAWTGLQTWLATSYERAPALVLGLAALLVIPPLALLGVVLRWRVEQTADDSTYLHPRRQPHSASWEVEGASAEPEPTWPSQAWLETDVPGGARYALGPGVTRIGREDDNDICIRDMTVHRYHAAIHRNDDAEFVITDLSSADGNGVVVNGRRAAEIKLRDGDAIELGLARFKFVSIPA